MFLVGGQRDASFMPEPVTGDEQAPVETVAARRSSGGSIGPDPFASIDDQPQRNAPAPAPRERVAARPPRAAEPAAKWGEDWLAGVERGGPPDAATPEPARPAMDAAAPADGETPEEIDGGAAAGDGTLQVITGGGGRGPRPRVSMRVVRGGADDVPLAEDGADAAGLQLGDEAARRLADDLVAALAATYPAKVARARADGQWSFHLGEVIRDARDDFHSVVAAEMAGSDELFNRALMRLVSGELDDLDDGAQAGDPTDEPGPDDGGAATR